MVLPRGGLLGLELLFDAFVFFAVGVEAALSVALEVALLHFLVPVASGDRAFVVFGAVALTVFALVPFDLGAFFFEGPGGFGTAAACFGGFGFVAGFLDGFELADQSQVRVAHLAFVAGVGEEGIGCGVFGEGFGDGEAGRVVGF